MCWKQNPSLGWRWLRCKIPRFVRYNRRPSGCSDSPHNSSRTQGAGDPGDRRSQKYLGQPYDDSFLPHNGKMYCSELVWECYLTGSKNEHLSQPGRWISARPTVGCRNSGSTISQQWTNRYRKGSRARIPKTCPGKNFWRSYIDIGNNPKTR